MWTKRRSKDILFPSIPPVIVSFSCHLAQNLVTQEGRTAAEEFSFISRSPITTHHQDCFPMSPEALVPFRATNNISPFIRENNALLFHLSTYLFPAIPKNQCASSSSFSSALKSLVPRVLWKTSEQTHTIRLGVASGLPLCLCDISSFRSFSSALLLSPQALPDSRWDHTQNLKLASPLTWVYCWVL